MHFVMPDGAHRAAVITTPPEFRPVNLWVFLDSTDLVAQRLAKPPIVNLFAVAHDSDRKRPNTWHWPEPV